MLSSRGNQERHPNTSSPGHVRTLKSRLVEKWFLQSRLERLAQKNALDAQRFDLTTAVNWQLDRFNRAWQWCTREVPFYRFWKAAHNLPAQIHDVQQLRDFPVLTKQIIQEHAELVFRHGAVKQCVSTGGSTGEPTRFPVAPADSVAAYATVYLGRSWHGIRPLDRTLHCWGHSHLFGSGVRGYAREWKRRVTDYLVNTSRLNAYDLNSDTVAQYAEILDRVKPEVFSGYTSCIFKIAKHLAENTGRRRCRGQLKAIILTSESVSKYDAELMASVFAAPIVVEYGLAETGAVAYSRESTWDIRVFWDAFIATANEKNILHVTTLDPRLFPLINYRTDDIVHVSRERRGSIFALAGIDGRSQDVVRIGSTEGTCRDVSGIAVVHVMKAYPRVLGVQCRQIGDSDVRLDVVSDRELQLERVKTYFMTEMRRDFGALDPDRVHFRQVQRLSKTVAGKEALVAADTGPSGIAT